MDGRLIVCMSWVSDCSSVRLGRPVRARWVLGWPCGPKATDFLSLRRHDPDQVQRVLFNKSQANGHPEEALKV